VSDISTVSDILLHVLTFLHCQDDCQWHVLRLKSAKQLKVFSCSSLTDIL